MRISLFVLVFIMLTFGEFAWADSKAKRLIFDDCEETKAALETLEPGEVDNFIGYLEKVISLPTGSASELLHEPDPIGLLPATPLQRTGHPEIEELKGNSISRTLEPSREIEAKRCAAGLLIRYGEKGAREIPLLVPLLEDQSLPDDVRVSIQQDIEALIKTSREAKSSVLQELQPALFQLSIENPQPSYQEVFLLLGEEAIPFLVQQLFGSDESRAELADRYLERLSPNRANSLPLIEIAFRQSSSAIQDRAIGYFTHWKRLPISLFDEILSKHFFEGGEKSGRFLEAALSQEATTDARFDSLDTFRSLLFQTAFTRDAYHRSGLSFVLPIWQLFVGDGIAEALTQQKNFDRLFLRILSRSMRAPDVREAIADSIRSLPPELRVAELPLLAVFSPSDRETFELCKDGLYSWDREIREVSFDCLGNSSEYSEDKAKALLQLLKSPSEKRDESRRQEGILQTLDVLTRLEPTVSRKPFLVYATEAMNWDPLPPRSFLEIGSGDLRTEERGGWEAIIRQNLDTLPVALKKPLAEGSEKRVERLLSFLKDVVTSLDARGKPKIRLQLESARKRFPGNIEIQAKVAEIDAMLDSSSRSQAASPTSTPHV